jgi:polar amino acid transport system permease protein
MIRSFGWNELLFILSATQWTVLLSLIALICGSVGGFLIALARVSSIAPLRYVTIGFIQLFQGTPLLMQLFLVFFGASALGLGIGAWVAVAIGFTLHSSAFLGEIWRGCIESVPKGQTEAANALGLSYVHRMRYVVLPQALRLALPPTVGFLVQLIKGTSVVAIIGFTELTRAGQIINSATFQPFLVFGIIGAIYFILCWPLSALSSRLELRLTRGNA